MSPTKQTRWYLSAILAVSGAAACDKNKGETTNVEDAVPEVAAPTPESVGACLDRIDTWIQLPNKPKEQEDDEWQAINKECGVLYTQCGGVDTMVAFLRGGNRALVLDLADQCATAYCGGFAEPRPKLCADARGILTGADGDAAAEASLEFHAALVAAEYQGGAEWDPLAERIAELWSGYGSIDLGETADVAALGFKVQLTKEGFVLSASSAHKWAKGGESETLELPLHPQKGKKPKPLDATRFDYAALAAEAKALKQANPDESSVRVEVDDGVPNDAAVRTMDALRGEGCTLEADASPSTVPDGCLFWRQILE